MKFKCIAPSKIFFIIFCIISILFELPITILIGKCIFYLITINDHVLDSITKGIVSGTLAFAALGVVGMLISGCIYDDFRKSWED